MNCESLSFCISIYRLRCFRLPFKVWHQAILKKFAPQLRAQFGDDICDRIGCGAIICLEMHEFAVCVQAILLYQQMLRDRGIFLGITSDDHEFDRIETDLKICVIGAGQADMLRHVHVHLVERCLVMSAATSAAGEVPPVKATTCTARINRLAPVRSIAAVFSLLTAVSA